MPTVEYVIKDELTLMQERFGNASKQINICKKYWKSIEAELKKLSNQLEKEQEEKISAKQKFKNVLNYAGSFFEPPNIHLKHVADKYDTKIENLRNQLQLLNVDLKNHLATDRDLTTVNALKFKICNTNIKLAETCSSLKNNLDGEIGYFKILASIASFVTTVAINFLLLPIVFPRFVGGGFSFGSGDYINKPLFSLAQAPMNRIEHWGVGIRREMNESLRLIGQNPHGPLKLRPHHSKLFKAVPHKTEKVRENKDSQKIKAKNKIDVNVNINVRHKQ